MARCFSLRKFVRRGVWEGLNETHFRGYLLLRPCVPGWRTDPVNGVCSSYHATCVAESVRQPWRTDSAFGGLPTCPKDAFVQSPLRSDGEHTASRDQRQQI